LRHAKPYCCIAELIKHTITAQTTTNY
jgi:hypothetical protein